LCEESQTVCIAFRNQGHEAFSCDIGKITDNYKERLRERLKKESLRNLKSEIEKNSDNTTYRIIE
jgi:hypothetical protein